MAVAVAVTEVSYSLEETIETSGMELQPGIAGQLAEATQGYPFMIQLVGYYAWQLARRAHTAIIGEEEAERGIATARERFCAMVIEPALQRIPPTCIAYLLSMASLGQTSSTSMVADALNKTPQQVSSVRSRLLRESIIEAPSYGKVSFAIPYMRDYLYEHKAELEVEL